MAKVIVAVIGPLLYCEEETNHIRYKILFLLISG